MTSRSDDPALRALRGLQTYDKPHGDDCPSPLVCLKMVERALVDAAEAAPLDVERLARALDAGLQLGQPWTSDIVPYHDFLMACATDIAREYAALRSPDTETAE